MREIALAAAEIAVGEIGVREEGNNRGARVEEYMRAAVPRVAPGDPWCAAFVVWCIRRAAEAVSKPVPAHFPISGWTPAFASWARQRGLWVSRDKAMRDIALVRRGDLLCFYRPQKRRIGHIGIVGAATQSGVWTVEGNTSDASFDDGDGVARKFHRWDKIDPLSGFALINF